MIRAGFVRQQCLFWGLILGLWFLLVLAFAGQLMLTSNVAWQEAIALSLRDWFPWAILAPLVAWLAFKFPIERSQWALSVPVHIAACMLAVVACDFLARPAPLPPGPPPGAGFQRFPGRGPAGSDRFNEPRLSDTPRPPQGPESTPQPDRPAEQRREFGAPAIGQEAPSGPQDSRPGFGGGFGPPMRGEGRRRFFVEGLVMRAKFNIPIYWIIVSIVHTLTWYRRSQERERSALQLEARLADARLEALRMQLHPAFSLQHPQRHFHPRPSGSSRRR